MLFRSLQMASENSAVSTQFYLLVNQFTLISKKNIHKTMATKKQKLVKLLSYLKDDEAMQLGGDTFLCTGGLDGSDKIYGFLKEAGELKVFTRQCSEGYPISDMDKDDLDYIFNLSTPNIAEKIGLKRYKVEKC